MPAKYSLLARIAASTVTLMLSAGAVYAQKGLLPPPQPDTPPPVPQLLQNYKSVTADRLKQPEDGDWPSYRRTSYRDLRCGRCDCCDSSTRLTKS
jgi:hypothetical protein